jgi:hypothetical protein
MKNYLITAIIFLLLPILALSQWSTDPAINNPINIMAGEQAIPKIATCPNGDSYIASFSNEGGNYNVRMQRLDAQGNPLWVTNGILISDNPQMTWLTDWDMTADNANYAILTFMDVRDGGNNNIFAYRISPDGSFIWGADGIALSSGTAFSASPKVTVTSAGNAVFAWQADEVTVMQKVSPSGSLLWGPDGITLSESGITYSWPQLLPVGTDDVIMKYFEDTGPSYSPTRHVFAQRYNSSGDAVWSSPATISNAGGISAWTQIFPFINDGNDGFYIAWHDDRDNNMLSSTYVQHISNSGAVLFITNGVEASTMGGRNHFYPYLALPPGSSNVYVFWNEMDGDQNLRGIYGQKLSSTGTRLWASTGKVFIEISSTNVYPYAAGGSPTDAVLFYEDYFDAINGQLKAMRVDADGNFVWTPSFKTICSVNSEKVHTVVNDFANNQWILSWEDNRNGESDIYAQNIQLNGDLGPLEVGTIEGMVTLVGGTASVTLVDVQAGDSITHPDATGFYSIVVPSGTYDVTGSLTGYVSDTVPGVAVLAGQTTSNINLTLVALPTGFITGTVVLNGGNGDVTETQVTAGYHTVYPDAQGNYIMEIEIGTYDVTAALAGYVAQTDPGIVVQEGMTTVGVDFELSPVPTTGFIDGMVVLQDGGDVSQVDVTAGTVTVNPDATGHYTLEITAGTWEVTASLPGYLTGVVPGVVVVVEQTTPDVDFYLYLAPDVGYIAGYVTLVNGIGDVTDATVAGGGQTTHPSATGYYFLALPEGSYTVTASHPYTLSDSITDVPVVVAQTTDNIDFELEIVRADLVCKAMDTYGDILNNIDVEITGPEGTYNGTITDDSLIFVNLPYGEYNGTAWMEGEDPDTASTVLGEFDHDIIFVFDLTGIQNGISLSENTLAVSPNPFSDLTNITVRLNDPSVVSLKIYSQQGQPVKTLIDGQLGFGLHQITWNGKNNSGQSVKPGIYTIVLQTSAGRQTKVIIKLN